MFESLEPLRLRDLETSDFRHQTSDVSHPPPQSPSLSSSSLFASSSSNLPQQKRAARKGLLLLILIQLIQRLLEALGETSEKPVDFFHMKVFEFFSCRAIGFLKFRISIADFFGAFEES